LVFGTLSHQQLLAGAAAYRLEPEAEHLAVRVRPTAECDARRVERLLQPARWTAGVVGVVDNDVVAVLRELPPTELPVTAGVGPPAVLGALSRSFAMAGRALEAALAFGRIGWHRLDDLSVRAAVVADDMVGELLDRCYLSALADLGPFGDELLTSVRTFFAHEQNVDVAARALFVHPNTLRHRLRRFEEVVGVNLRNPDHLVEVWWTLRRGDLRGDGP
ncbi:MAG: PucR family transcriptional regulator, partial [Acidimicrobiales bacterium]